MEEMDNQLKPYIEQLVQNLSNIREQLRKSRHISMQDLHISEIQANTIYCQICMRLLQNYLDSRHSQESTEEQKIIHERFSKINLNQVWTMILGGLGEQDIILFALKQS